MVSDTSKNCIVYYRMSSDQQLDSIERQKTEVLPRIKRDSCNVLREFADRGKSGSKNRAKREGFLQMLDFIRERNDISRLYLWDLSRFTREHPFNSAELYKLLMEKSITICDCKGGEYDLSTQQGRMTVNLLQELNYQYSTNLSVNTTSGRRKLLKEGWWVAGSIPYGFKRRYLGPNGEEIIRPRLDSGYKKPRGYHLALVANEEESRWVKGIFQKYQNSDTSLRSIARWLNENGVVPPSGDISKGWKHETIKNIIRNRAYCGYSHIGRKRPNNC